MTMEIEILNAAIDVIDDEQYHLTNEIRAWEEFRESVRLLRPVSDEKPERTNKQVDPATIFRDTVMTTYDFVNNDKILQGDLQNEFSPRLVEAMVNSDVMTQRLKRDFLVASSDAVNRRKRFYELLDHERGSLDQAGDALCRIRTKIEELPDLSLQTKSLEEYLEIRSSYEAAERACRKLLKVRQGAIISEGMDIESQARPHSLNEYLYSELETTYPVLTEIASTIEQLDDLT